MYAALSPAVMRTTYNERLTANHKRSGRFGCRWLVGKRRGFTLIELLVVVAIATLITGAVLAENGQFDDRVALNNLAHEIAVTIRKAQVVGSNNSQGRGIYINFDNPGDARKYQLYYGSGGSSTAARLAGVKYYSPARMLDTFTIGRGSRISKLCLTKFGTTSCFDGSGSVRSVDISFARPAQSAQICTNASGCYEQVDIFLTGIRGGERTVTVYQSGQIQVE